MANTAILGLNARNRLFLTLNSKSGRQVADSKLLTKKVLEEAELLTPSLLQVFKTPGKIANFSWESLPDNFVLKPSSGFGGQGVMIVKKKAKWAGEWYLMDDTKIAIRDLRFHALEILSGRFSLHNLPDKAFVEERIKIQKVFSKYVYHGAPDVRVIVFNKVPVAAMLRLPTKQSEGKSNLHQGAIGVGVDLATGITTHGIWENHFIKYIPETKRKINGLKIPEWNKILTLAVKAQIAVPSLGYIGVDIIIDKERGPMILELNTRPGLGIQNANLAPLRKRLERVEGLEVEDAEQGVKIAKALFAEKFASQVASEEAIKIVTVFEEIKIKGRDKSRTPVLAKLDTGAWRTSIDEKFARKLGLLRRGNILWRQKTRSALGKRSRPVIELTFYLKGRKIKTIAGVANREKLRSLLLIGRKDLSGFLVKPKQD